MAKKQVKKKAARKPATAWKLASEELPTNAADVLVQQLDGETPFVGWYNADRKWWWLCGIKVKSVYAWCPIPE